MIDDTITDEEAAEVFEAVGDSLSAVSMDRPLEAITARGQGLRRRRRALNGVAVAGVLGVSLAMALPLSGASGGQRLSANGHPVNVDMAGWSVHTNANSTVTVTVRQVFDDPAALRTVLHNAGIHAIVREIKPGDPSMGCAIASKPISDYDAFSLASTPGELRFIVNPAAMPPGSVLEILVYDVEMKDPFPPATHHPSTHAGRTLTSTVYAGDPGPCVPDLRVAPGFLSGRK
ncbi:MAG TPA: hypothetical protein VFU65_02440 [Actinocrinis sp.]|nr:hypothetical protein [Actinocrinis sp.]